MPHRSPRGGSIVTSHRCAAVLLSLSAVFTPVLAGAEEAAKSDNHGYFGVGLQLESNTSQTALGDFQSTGGGLILNGAGVIDAGNVGFGLNGGFGFASRTDSDSDVTIAEGTFGFDGGVVLADIFYLSFGVNLLNQTPDSTDVVTTYTVVPLGLGVLAASDTGYMLAQLRFGGGEASNDQNNATADLSYFGIRLVGQTGTADGVQFMGGLEFDTYDFADVDITDNFFRFFIGVGFGG